MGTPLNPRKTLYLFTTQEALLITLKGFTNTRPFCNFAARQRARRAFRIIKWYISASSVTSFASSLLFRGDLAFTRAQSASPVTLVYFRPLNSVITKLSNNALGYRRSFATTLRQGDSGAIDAIKHSCTTVHSWLSARLISLSSSSDGWEYCENKDTRRPAREGHSLPLCRDHSKQQHRYNFSSFPIDLVLANCYDRKQHRTPSAYRPSFKHRLRLPRNYYRKRHATRFLIGSKNRAFRQEIWSPSV